MSTVAVSSRDHIQLLLQTNSMVYDISDQHILQVSMQAVIEFFGGFTSMIQCIGIKSMLQFITTHSNIDQLKSINNIIKEKKIELQNHSHCPESDEIKDDNDINEDINDDISENNDNDLFATLPNECIHNICNYMNRQSIKSFKLSSRQIAIICLQQMDRITVGVLPYHLFVSNNNINLYHFSMNKQSYKTRHVATKRFDSLFEEWANYYRIPQQNQFIFSHWTPFGNRLFMHNPATMRSSKINKDTYLLCDNRNIVILNDKKAHLFDINKDNVGDLYVNYSVMILEYFDIIKQTLQIVQIILHKNDISRTQLFWYIEHGFITITNNNIDNEWHNQLLVYLKKMRIDPQNRKLCMVKYSDSRMMHEVQDGPLYNVYDDTASSFYSFQLNYKHPWFQKTNKLQRNMLKYPFNGCYDAIMRLYDICDLMGEKLLIQHLLKREMLNEENVTCLNIVEKEELQRGLQCLAGDYFDPLVNMVQSLLPDDFDDLEDGVVELDVDAIDDAIQVKMYNYMLKAISLQEKESTKLLNQQQQPS